MALTLQAASQRITTSSTKLRVAIFRASVSSLLDSSDESLTEHAASLADLIFETLHLYNDRASQAAVEAVLMRALKEPSFVKVFTGMLLQTADKARKAGTFSVYYKLLRWSCLLLRWNTGILAAKVAFSKLAAVQGALLSSLLQAVFRIKRATKRVFFHTLTEVQGLFELYVNELKGSPLSTESLSGLTAILLDYCSSKSAELFNNQKDLFLDLYMKTVLNSKDKPLNVLSYAFTPLLKKLSHDDFGRILVPTAVKMLKRNPELVLEAVGILLQLTMLDLSKYVGDLLPVLLVQARHNDETRRKESVVVIGYLASQSSDPDAILSMFQIIKSVIGGSEGKLSFPYQRDGMINSLRAISSAPGGKTLTQLAATICVFLMSYYKEDGNEEVRTSVLLALGVWLSRTGDLVPEGAMVFFLGGFKEKETLRRFHLRSLCMGFRNSHCSLKMHTLSEPLLTFSKNWVTKPSQRVDSIYALLILLQIASVDIKADDRIAKEKLWASILQKDSGIFSTSLIHTLGDVSVHLECTHIGGRCYTALCNVWDISNRYSTSHSPTHPRHGTVTATIYGLKNSSGSLKDSLCQHSGVLSSSGALHVNRTHHLWMCSTCHRSQWQQRIRDILSQHQHQYEQKFTRHTSKGGPRGHTTMLHETVP